MTENRENRLDARLRHALHDLDERAAQHVAPVPVPDITVTTPHEELTSGGTPRQRRRLGQGRGRLVPALAGFVVILVLITAGWLARPTNSTQPTHHPTPSTSPSVPGPSPTDELGTEVDPETLKIPDVPGPSQSAADAARDTIDPRVAALPLIRRVQPGTSVTGEITAVSTPEGLWIIADPDVYSLTGKKALCLPGTSTGVAYTVCRPYREILLLSPDLRKVIRAYPFPDVAIAPGWLVVTPDAIYCGRRGDEWQQKSMICRINRPSPSADTPLTLIGRIFPSPPIKGVPGRGPESFTGWPGTWSNNSPSTWGSFNGAELRAGRLQILGENAEPVTQLDPQTLIPDSPVIPPVSGRSQSASDATRDKVYEKLAKLPLKTRVVPVFPNYPGIPTWVTSPEGTWLISRPDILALTQPAKPCLTPGTKSRTLEYDACEDYTEILLMTPDLTRIIKAYPIPDLPVQWLSLTADAVYCGRQGDGGIPESMVCRIDRTSGQLTGRVFPSKDAVDQGTPRAFKGWPGTWSNNTPITAIGFDQAQLSPGVLHILAQNAKPTITLNPQTLTP
jgi:hypothetical protein